MPRTERVCFALQQALVERPLDEKAGVAVAKLVRERERALEWLDALPVFPGELLSSVKSRFPLRERKNGGL